MIRHAEADRQGLARMRYASRGRFSMHRIVLAIVLGSLLTVLLGACGGSSSDPDPVTDDPPTAQTRSFFMGFTPWQYKATLNATDVTYQRLIEHGDMIKHHLQGGIPWQEALDFSTYHSNVEAEINNRLGRTPKSLHVFLSIDALNTGRDGLAPYWAETDNMDLPPEWASRSWDSPDVIAAYINFANDMIDRFEPDYFEYGAEVSELIINDPDGYDDFLVFAEAVSSALHDRYPDLKLVVSVAMKSPGSAEQQLINAGIGEVIQYADVVGLSVYPYAFYDHADRGDPANLPNDWLNQAELFASGKPLAISETGWIGEDLAISEFEYAESSSPAEQAAYAETMLTSAGDMNMEFVIWWTITDFDALWNNELAQDPVAKIWKDIGLYDQDQQPRDALQHWDDWLQRTRQ